MSNLGDKRDGLESLLGDVPVVAIRPVPLPLKLKRGVLVDPNQRFGYYDPRSSDPCSLLKGLSETLGSLPVSCPCHADACTLWST